MCKSNQQPQLIRGDAIEIKDLAIIVSITGLVYFVYYGCALLKTLKLST